MKFFAWFQCLIDKVVKSAFDVSGGTFWGKILFKEKKIIFPKEFQTMNEQKSFRTFGQNFRWVFKTAFYVSIGKLFSFEKTMNSFLFRTLTKISIFVKVVLAVLSLLHSTWPEGHFQEKIVFDFYESVWTFSGNKFSSENC